MGTSYCCWNYKCREDFPKRTSNIQHQTPNIEIFLHRLLGRLKFDVRCSMFLLRLCRARLFVLLGLHWLKSPCTPVHGCERVDDKRIIGKEGNGMANPAAQPAQTGAREL